jgi:HEAT repeat protein
MDDADLHVRRAATTAMASLLGPPPSVAQRLLAALASDGDAATRRIAALALGELGAADPGLLPADAAAHLARAAEASDDPDLRRAVERALVRLGAGSS